MYGLGLGVTNTVPGFVPVEATSGNTGLRTWLAQLTVLLFLQANTVNWSSLSLKQRQSSLSALILLFERSTITANN